MELLLICNEIFLIIEYWKIIFHKIVILVCDNAFSVYNKRIGYALSTLLRLSDLLWFAYFIFSTTARENFISSGSKLWLTLPLYCFAIRSMLFIP